MKQASKRKSRGFTLIELMVVIAIVGIAVVAIIARRASTNQTSQIQTEASNIQAIMGKVHSTFAGRPNYSGISTAFLLAQGAFPTSMVNGTNVVNTWQGAVTVAAGTGNTTVNVTYAGVPSAACIELVANTSRSFNEVTVGTTVTKNGAAVSDLAVTQTACTAAATVPVIFNAS